MGASVVYAGISFVVFILVVGIMFIILEMAMGQIQATGFEQSVSTLHNSCWHKASGRYQDASGTMVEYSILQTRSYNSGENADLNAPRDWAGANPFNNGYAWYIRGFDVWFTTGLFDAHSTGNTPPTHNMTPICQQSLEWFSQWKKVDFMIRMAVALTLGMIITMVVLRALMSTTALGRD